jgi:hypothetical protein
LKNIRWPLLRKGSRVREHVRKKLNTLLASKLATARAWRLKESFHHFRDLQVADLGWRISRGLVHSGPAQPPGADEEGGPNAAGER